MSGLERRCMTIAQFTIARLIHLESMDGTLRVDVEPRDNAHWADGHWLGALPGRIARLGCIEPDHSTARRI